MDYWQTGLDANGDIGGVGTFGYRDFQDDFIADYNEVAASNYILGFSYENRLVAKYLDSTHNDFVEHPDYFVFDHGLNDLANPDYDTNEASAISVPTIRDDRTFFIGAMNYLIDVILSYNPRARIIFIGHYEKERFTQTFKGQENLFNYWDFPSIKLWSKIGWTQNQVVTNGYWSENVWYESGGASQTLTFTQIWMEDNLHPDTLITRQLIADVLTPFIRDSF